MYLPSNAPILTDQRAAAARHGAESDARLRCSRKLAAEGRLRSFDTLISPEQIQQSFGTGAAVNAAKLQDQTETSRATGLLGSAAASGPGGGGPSLAQIIAGAPEVVSLNRGGGCQKERDYVPVPLGPDPVPVMPHRAPVIVQGPTGPLYFTGAPQSNQPVAQPYMVQPTVTQPLPVHWGPATSQPASLAVAQYYKILNTQGLTGYAPPWSDADVLSNGGVPDSGVGVGNWLMEHPWLALLAAGAGVLAISRRKGR